MDDRKAIGGYFELELNNSGSVFHDKAIPLNSGRNAFEFILIQQQISKIYLPYYTCDAVLQPIERQKIGYEFYKLNEDLSPAISNLKKSEGLLYTNYFGVMGSALKEITHRFSTVITDNSQAFFEMPYNNTPTFYSPRKFFGLPDGGFAYVAVQNEMDLERDKSGKGMSHLIDRIEHGAEEGYKYFRQNETRFNDLPLKRMSKLTENLLKNIDFEKIKKTRKQNFDLYHCSLGKINQLTPIIDSNRIISPMVYPFLREGNAELRNKLIEHKIFVASYWPNVSRWMPQNNSFELYLQHNLIPLPIDQRISVKDIHKILEIISGY